MSKINLYRKTITSKRNGWGYKSEWIQCDLALPEGELKVIAELLKRLEWISDAMVKDCVLCIDVDREIIWSIKERAIINAISVIREQIAEAQKNMGVFKPEKIPFVTFQGKGSPSYYSGSKAYSKGGSGYYINSDPDDRYKVSFVVEDQENGELLGYYLTSNDVYNRNETKNLAVMILALIDPEASVKTIPEGSWGEVPLGKYTEDLEEKALQAYNLAYFLERSLKKKMDSLQWKGHPSAFLAEDDDARDILFERVKSGARIKVERVTEENRRDQEEYCHYSVDGEEVPNHLVYRLLNSDMIEIEGLYQRMDEEPKDLILSRIYKSHLERPRNNSVSWQSFQSYCSYRRYDNYSECSHKKCQSDDCKERSCPLVIQVYSEDNSGYSSRFRDDPAFDDYDYEKDFLVRALHPNTRKSFAWRASGEDAVMAVVNQALHSYCTYKAPFLFGKEVEAAVRKAVEAGYLEIDQEMPGFGLVARPSETLISNLEKSSKAPVKETQEKDNVQP
jgi:hypothetical protein